MNKNIWIAIIFVIVLIIGAVYFYQNRNGAQNLYLEFPVEPPSASSVSPESTPTPQATVSQKTYNISVANFAFNPATMTINQGDTVAWTNQDSAPHQIWGSDFKSGVLSNGQSFSFTFSKTGTFDYICSIHQSMKGQVLVR